MAAKQIQNVTMRVRVGDSEVEVTGPVDFVEKKVAEFLAKQGQAVDSTSRRATGGATEGAEAPKTRKKAMAVAQFFKKVGPKTDVNRALAAGYYMERYKNEESFTAAEVYETIRAAKISPPGNPSDTIAKNVKKGYMMAAGEKDGKRAFVLTTDGEDAIAESLDA